MLSAVVRQFEVCAVNAKFIQVELHFFFFIYRAREALRACLPDQLKDSTFAVTLKDDSTTKKWLSQLLQNLGLDSMILPTTSSSAGAPVPTTS